MMSSHPDLRLSLPSKGRLGGPALDFLAACGLRVEKPNPRQYAARIPALPALTVLFQRPGDIVVSVRDGSVDFGLTGMDQVAEHRGENGRVLVLHDALRFGRCRLCLAVPEEWPEVRTVEELAAFGCQLGRPLRVATKFQHLTGAFLERNQVPYTVVHAEGALEVAPTIGYADLICDLVSSGQTLRDNRLRPLEGGVVIASQAALIASRAAIKSRPGALSVAQILLEFVEAHLRAADHMAIFANMRGVSPDDISQRMFAQQTLGGLQGPTFSRVVVPDGDPNWHAVHIIVPRDQLFQAVAELRAIGGSGVVVTPVSYIFEEEPDRYRAMLDALERDDGNARNPR
jgi:ATP phosphoribosyltransferase